MEVENEKKLNKKIKLDKIFKVILLLFIVVILGTIIYFNFGNKKKPKMIVTSILQDQKVISQLSTLIVPYGGVYEGIDEKGKAIQIAYRGTVTYGVDFSKIEIIENEEKKLCLIMLPQITLLDVYVIPNSLSSIPEGEIDDLEKRLIICKNDLIEKFNTDNDGMYELAAESTKDTILNFLNPIISELDDNYEIVVDIERQYL